MCQDSLEQLRWCYAAKHTVCLILIRPEWTHFENQQGDADRAESNVLRREEKEKESQSDAADSTIRTDH